MQGKGKIKKGKMREGKGKNGSVMVRGRRGE